MAVSNGSVGHTQEDPATPRNNSSSGTFVTDSESVLGDLSASSSETYSGNSHSDSTSSSSAPRHFRLLSEIYDET